MIHAGSLLLVDDEELNRDMLARRLEFHGYVVTSVESARDALALLGQQSFDLVLLDVMMPEVNGMQVLQRIRAEHTPAELPVIMVTARTQSEDLVEAFQLGANDYVTKPVDMPIALARIATQVSLKRAQAALRESETRYALAARGANDGLWDWNLLTNEVYYSPRWKAMLGHEEDEIAATPEEWFKRIHPDDLQRVQADLAAHQQGTTLGYENEHRMLHRDGHYRWMLTRAAAVRDKKGRAVRMAGSQTDITAGTVADALTGLPNRILFVDRLERALERAKRHPQYLFAVFFLDLDRFKVINDSLGHLIGDKLLIGIARRLEECLRSTDTVARLEGNCTIARLGGDEFTILLDGISSPDDVSGIAERLVKKLAGPFDLSGNEVFTSASIGIAVGNSSYDQPDELLRDADTALYCAKARGRSRFEIFDSAMRAQAIARLELENELRRAIDHQEFCLFYQPILSLMTGTIIGFEALVRWRHPTRGLISPVEFITVAEETKLILPLGQWVLREACKQMRAWQEGFPTEPPLLVSVNVSTKQFLQTDLVTQVKQTLEETGLPPSSLKLEITESAIMDDPEVAAMLLTQLRTLGIQVGIDDFGTGHSSLSYLHRFPVDTLKIDRSFVNRLENSQENVEIVQAIVTLAHILNMDVVAEGVETAVQSGRLRAMSCEYGQGYLFSKPIERDDVARLLMTHKRRPKELPLEIG